MRENVFIKVMIVDDEQFVREGLRNIIDWNSLGMIVCAEAGSSTEAFQKLKKYHPQLILLDIRMPGMYGTDFIRIARQNGYTGEFIVLSGYSDFTYAQTALQYGTAYYLTKPIDEEKLAEAVTTLRDRIIKREEQARSLDVYQEKARSVIFRDLLEKEKTDPTLDYIELGFSAPVYQVLIYENFTPYYTSSFNFADILRVSGDSRQSFDYIQVDGRDIVLLKGDYALDRFQTVLDHYREGAQKGSPLDMVFLAYGPIVSSLSQIHTSYETCLRLMGRRFFCEESQHVLSYEDLRDPGGDPVRLTEDMAGKYERQLSELMKTGNRSRVRSLLDELEKMLRRSDADPAEIRTFLAGMFIHIRTTIANSYRSLDLPFVSNSIIIRTIDGSGYLYEIMRYFSTQFEMIMNAVGDHSGANIIEDVTDYIDHNYMQPLKLESIAMLFGYNSSYLGKLFTSEKGENFNAYLDEVRIRESLKLLSDTDMKIYEIAAQVGYGSVDYFHQKFRKRMHMSPAEYRKSQR